MLEEKNELLQMKDSKIQNASMSMADNKKREYDIMRNELNQRMKLKQNEMMLLENEVGKLL